MARRSKAGDGFLIVVGVIGAAIYMIIKLLEHFFLWISENRGLCIVFVFVIWLAFVIWKYLQWKRAEESRILKLTEEEQIRKSEETEIEKRRKFINSFKSSSDYKLIEGYISKYGYNENTRYGVGFDKLVKVIGYSTQIDRDTLLKLLEEENSFQIKESFKREIKRYNPALYNEYLEAALESQGDDIESYSADLHDLLIGEGIIHRSAPISDTISNLSRIRHSKMKESLERHLFDQSSLDIRSIDQMKPSEFEQYVAKLYKNKGYSAEVTKLTGDQGADVLIEKFGERTVIQVKLYSQTVGNKSVQEVCAAIKHYHAHKGIVITNNYFTGSARELAKSNNITLIDRDQLKLLL